MVLVCETSGDMILLGGIVKGRHRGASLYTLDIH